MNDIVNLCDKCIWNGEERIRQLLYKANIGNTHFKKQNRESRSSIKNAQSSRVYT